MVTAQLFERIVHVAPEFAPLVAEHVRENDDLLPHLLMADLLRFVALLLERADEPATRQLHGILDHLESELANNIEETRDLIAVSFLEHLETEPFYLRLYALLGPRTRAAHSRIQLGLP